jgi:hypothetical protein
MGFCRVAWGGLGLVVARDPGTGKACVFGGHVFKLQQP